VLDKPAVPPAANTWAAGIWSDAFTALLHDSSAGWAVGAGGTGATGGTGGVGSAGGASVAEGGREPVLGDVFERAIREGMRVVGLEFRAGSFTAIGTPDGMRRCLAGARQPAMAGQGGRR
jgi:hypothetical protein